MGEPVRIFGLNLRLGAGVVACVLLMFAGVFFGLPRLEHYFLLKAGDDQAATLRLAVQSLRLTLERYALIPNLIAARPEIRALLNDPENDALRQDAEKLLAETAIALRASGVYLEGPTGTPIIAIPTLTGATGGQAQIQYRPYFSQAVAGGLGQYYALGTPSGERGFFYAAPVHVGNRISGVVAIKFAVDQFEATWGENRAEIIVRDSNDIVFMSSRPAWNFRAMAPISDEKLELIAAAGQYPLEQLVPLPNGSQPLDDRFKIIEFDEDEAKESFVSSTSLIARAGWRVTILTPTGDALTLARTAAAVVVLLLLLAGLLTALLLQRRARLSERLAAQKAAQDMLELRVDERTAELNAANTRLISEVEERKHAEQQLRKTQTELIQAGKLAALGQMSAALAHELNQPLAAAKAYAENALAFMQRGRDQDAADNVSQISSLTDRMSAIAKHLRNFARRPQEKTRSVPLVAVIDDALTLMGPKLSSADASVHFERPDEVWVTGGQLRLQQVFVNLISNAIDAMADCEKPSIVVSVHRDGGEVSVDVRDHGDGLSDEALKLLFDPFFTTKDPGKGLGLGLSISYNIVRDFGGSLSATNHPEGGALFRVVLKSAEAPPMTGEPQLDAAQ